MYTAASFARRTVRGLLVTLMTCPAALAQDGPPAGYLIRDVAVIDVERGAVSPPRDVTIDGTRIREIAPPGAIDAGDLHVIDGRGLYLMPGLFDAHVHIMPSVGTFGPLLIANGVTCVRDTGAPTDVILGLRRQAARAEALLPRIVCTGAIVDGDPPVWPFSEPCSDAEAARAAVRKLAGAGVDQIKVYSRLDAETYRAAVDEAHRLGLKATGHVPYAVGMQDAIDAGQDCIEHLTGFEKAIAELTGWTPPADADATLAWFGAWETLPGADPEKLDAFAQRLAAAGMHQCPTIIVMKGVGSATDVDAADADPRMAYVPESVRSFWRSATYSPLARHAGPMVRHMQSMAATLHRAGVPLMVGTDLANPYVYAGFAVHEEMTLLQEAGIPPADVLRAATIVPARFCGVQDELGTVTPGKSASLVLVRANPLDDVAGAAQIEATFLAGRYFDRAALDELLEDVKKSVAGSKTDAPTGEIDMDLPGEVVHRGRYTFEFGGMDAGAERFVITRDQTGHHLKTHNQPRGGPQTPFLLEAHMDEDFAYRRVVWTQLGGAGVEATYTFKDGTLTATARRGGAEIGTKTIALGDDALFSTPAGAAELMTVRQANLAVGQTRTYRLITFGFPSWEPTVSNYTITRGEDATRSLDGTTVTTQSFSWTMPTDWGDFSGRMTADSTGRVLYAVLDMPFGRLTTTLDGLDD